MTNEKLIENLLFTFPDSLNGLSAKVKECILKDRIVNILTKIAKELNNQYEEVNFYLKWTKTSCGSYLNSDGHLCAHGYDEHQQSDLNYDYGFCFPQHEDEWEEFLGQCDDDLETYSIVLTYIRSQTCNLGHVHKNKRFYQYSIPRVMEMISFYLNNPDWPTRFVKEYVPNFFDCTPRNVDISDEPKHGSTDAPDSTSEAH